MWALHALLTQNTYICQNLKIAPLNFSGANLNKTSVNSIETCVKLYLCMKKLQFKILIVSIVALFLGSCVSNKRVVYFQEKNAEVSYSDTFKYDRTYYKLQPHDIINVEVTGTNENFVKIFQNTNPSSQNLGNIGVTTGSDLFYTVGYTINDSGYIKYPLVGYIKVSGLTILEIGQKIEAELKLFEANMEVTARIGGIRFSLLGEFNRPGKYVLMQNQVNLFEAVSIGGDLKEIARRDKVVLLRQYPDGAKIHYIDLLDKNVINSPYYFLQPNDVLYVEPLKRRAYGIGVNGLQTLTTLLSIISTTLVVITFLNQ